jgi:4'-phosphopantetheinyl transferase
MELPAKADLRGDEVHLWLIDLDQPEECRDRLGAVLQADERERAARFLRRQHQDRFRVGRGGLRVVLGKYLATEPGLLQFDYGAHGKPALAGGAELRFNLSHPDRWALLGVVRGSDIGVDIEAIRDLADIGAVAERTFTPGENRALATLLAALYARGFNACWMSKEAMVKAAGVGFAFELDGSRSRSIPRSIAWTSRSLAHR